MSGFGTVLPILIDQNWVIVAGESILVLGLQTYAVIDASAVGPAEHDLMLVISVRQSEPSDMVPHQVAVVEREAHAEARGHLNERLRPARGVIATGGCLRVVTALPRTSVRDRCRLPKDGAGIPVFVRWASQAVPGGLP